MVEPLDPKDEEIRQLFEAFKNQSRRGTQVAGVAPLLGAAAVGAFFVYAVLKVMDSPLANFDSRDSVRLVIDEDIKKQAELLAGTEDDGERDTVSELAFALRQESLLAVGALVENGGAEEALWSLAEDSGEGWADFVAANAGTGAFERDLLNIATLGLATLSAGDYRNAEATPLGVDVAQALRASREPGFGSAQTASIVLTSLDRPPDDSLPNIVPNGDPVPGSFSEFSDNWYRIVVNENGRYRLETRAPESGLGADTELRLLDQDFRELGYDDDGGSGTYSFLRERLGAGNYYLKVSSYDLTPGGYFLTVDEDESPVADESGSPFRRVGDGEASPLAIDMPRDGSVNGEDPAWYEITITEPGAYTIRTSEPPSGFGVDTVVRLYTGDQSTQIGEDDDSGDDDFSLLTEDLLPGTHYLSVSSYFLEPGEFVITVEGPNATLQR